MESFVTDVDECPGNNICHPLASLSCKCNAGYEGDGETCTSKERMIDKAKVVK